MYSSLFKRETLIALGCLQKGALNLCIRGIPPWEKYSDDDDDNATDDNDDDDVEDNDTDDDGHVNFTVSASVCSLNAQ